MRSLVRELREAAVAPCPGCRLELPVKQAPPSNGHNKNCPVLAAWYSIQDVSSKLKKAAKAIAKLEADSADAKKVGYEWGVKANDEKLAKTLEAQLVWEAAVASNPYYGVNPKTYKPVQKW